jgi:hypothetical protein
MPVIVNGRPWRRLPSPRRTKARSASGLTAGRLAVAVMAGVGMTVVAPAAGAPEEPPAVVEPFVDCVRHDGNRDTYWFGYEMTDGRPQLVPSGRRTAGLRGVNEILESEVDDPAATNRGQVEHFTAGVHHFAFAVTVERGQLLKWVVAMPAEVADDGSAKEHIAITEDLARCGPGTPRHSATAQTTGVSPAIRPSAGPELRILGRLVLGTVKFELVNVVSACSTGGTPLPPLVFWGYDDTVQQANEGLPLEVPRDGFAALPRLAIVRVDVFGGRVPFQRTLFGTRLLAHPQRPWTDPETGVTSRGVAATMVLADVYGRCRFGRDVITSREPMWGPATGFPALAVSVTDEATQTTMPLTCTLEPGCPVRVLAGPGGSRWR